MGSLVKKRKGSEILQPSCWDYHSDLTLDLSCLSLEDYSSLRKKCREDLATYSTSSSKTRVSRAVTAPPSGHLSSDSPGRGLKRKIGCIDVATKMGRKKKIEQDYDLGSTIGLGKFGSIVACHNKMSGEDYACKILKKGEELVHREVEIMQHLSGHPGIVTLKAVYEDPESFYLVMELCSSGRLLDQMAREGQYSEHQAAKVLKEVVLVIKYCHDMGVVHRDIKPENILLTSTGCIKLADFGLATRVVSGHRLSGVVGSPAYVAPEVLDGEYSEKVDIWSAGVLLYVLVAGVLPFQGSSSEEVFEAIKNNTLDLESGIWASVSQPARDLISCMLLRDVSKRLSADEVLRHSWILFYTRPAMPTLTLKLRRKVTTRSTSQQLTTEPRFESCTNLMNSATILTDTDPTSPGSSKYQEEDDRFDDVLVAAISQLRISEQKRIRICNPAAKMPTRAFLKSKI